MFCSSIGEGSRRELGEESGRLRTKVTGWECSQDEGTEEQGNTRAIPD